MSLNMIIHFILFAVSLLVVYNKKQLSLPVLSINIVYLLIVIFNAVKNLNTLGVTSAPSYAHLLNNIYPNILLFLITLIAILYKKHK